jgi:hypothetical protein
LQVLALILSLTSVCNPRPDLADWPPGTDWILIRDHIIQQGRPEEAKRSFDWLMDSEYASFLGSSMVLVGTVTSVAEAADNLEREGTLLRRAVPVHPRHLITVAVEDCLKGDCCGGEVKMFMSRRLPEVGRRYVFFAREFRGVGRVHLTCPPDWMLLVEDDVVAQKGIELGTFLAVMHRHLATRTPEALYRSSDGVILGTVTGQESSIRFENDPMFPGDHNFVRLSLESVGRGPFAVGDTLEVRLGYHSIPDYGVYEAVDSPRFTLGERVVLFLCEKDIGEWFPGAGADSRLTVRPDGSFLRWRSLSDLARDVGH